MVGMQAIGAAHQAWRDGDDVRTEQATDGQLWG